MRDDRPNRAVAEYPTIDLDGCITDVPGLQVGQTRRAGRGWRTGTTVVVAPNGATAGVDVRGGGPGTHETDLLRPENLVEQVHAVCLTGGSAYGLAAATGVMLELERRGIGFAVGERGERVVPIVPAAVIFDLGRGGRFEHRPDLEFGSRATRAARPRACATGSEGAGTGAVSAGLQGGVGTASTRLDDGTIVAALAVVNSLGTVIDPSTGLPWETADLHGLRPPRSDERAALRKHLERLRMPLTTGPGAPESLNTTIGVVAVSARLTKAQCTKVASVAHDGMARAIRPSHTMFDGDTVFGLAVGADGATDLTASSDRTGHLRLNRILEAGAACFAAACTAAIVRATSWPGGPPAYRDVCPSAWGRSDAPNRPKL
jgi:putative pantetheine hydrolase